MNSNPNLAPGEYSQVPGGVEYPATKLEYARHLLRLGTAVSEFCFSLDLSDQATIEVTQSAFSKTFTIQSALIALYEASTVYKDNETGYAEDELKDTNIAPIPITDNASEVTQPIDQQTPKPFISKTKTANKDEKPIEPSEKAPNPLLDDGFTLPDNPFGIRKLKRQVIGLNRQKLKGRAEDTALRSVVDIFTKIPSNEQIPESSLKTTYSILKEECYAFIWQQLEPLIHTLVLKNAKHSSDHEVLLAVAHKDLLNALYRFDPSFENKFTTYVSATILGGIKRYYRDTFISTSMHTRGTYEKTSSILARLRNGFTLEEIAAHMTMSLDEVKGLLSFHELHGKQTSLELAQSNSRGEVYDTITDRASGPEQVVLDTYFSEELQNAFKKAHIKKSELTVLEYAHGIYRDTDGNYYYSPFNFRMTQAEIGRMLGVTQVHVGRLIKNPLERVKEILGLSSDKISEILGA